MSARAAGSLKQAHCTVQISSGNDVLQGDAVTPHAFVAHDPEIISAILHTQAATVPVTRDLNRHPRTTLSSPSLRWLLLRLSLQGTNRQGIHRALTGTDEPVPKSVRCEMRVLLDQSGRTRQC